MIKCTPIPKKNRTIPCIARLVPDIFSWLYNQVLMLVLFAPSGPGHLQQFDNIHRIFKKILIEFDKQTHSYITTYRQWKF